MNFNEIDYQMASRGDQYMKMIWARWPDVGFEPRYGGDIAFGEYAIANYLAYQDKLRAAQSDIHEIEELTNNQTSYLPTNVTTSYLFARALLNDAMCNFSDGWLAIAVAELGNATRLAEFALKELAVLTPLNSSRTTVQIETAALLALMIFTITINVYWYRKIRQRSSSRTRGEKVRL